MELVTVPLVCGAEAVVDQELVNAPIRYRLKSGESELVISRLNWKLTGEKNRRHVFAKVGDTMVGLHRLILGVSSPSIHVDHIDGNPLNNRRANLRLATNQQNLRNMRSKGGSSKYKGVSKSGSAFAARIMVDGKDVHQKRFHCELEAARQYDAWAQELFGEFAWLNREHFPELQGGPTNG